VKPRKDDDRTRAGFEVGQPVFMVEEESMMWWKWWGGVAEARLWNRIG
jgi:hypothetical protein